eukprot:g3275.t1
MSSTKQENPTAKLFIGAGITWVFELCFGNCLEFVKIRKQTSGLPYPKIISNIVQHKGLVGFLDGYFPWGSLQAVAKGSSFAYGQALGQNFLMDNFKSMDSFTVNILSGGIGGMFQGVVMSPILLLKTRVMTDPAFRSAGGAWETTIQSTKLGSSIIKTEGLLSLTKGLPLFTVKRFLDWTSRYLFVEVVQGQYVAMTKTPSPNNNYSLTFTEKTLCALGGGVLSALATIPVDVMVATKQQATQSSSKGDGGSQTSISRVMKAHYDEGGIKRILEFGTRGFIARVIHVSLTVALMKTTSSAVYEKLYGSK